MSGTLHHFEVPCPRCGIVTDTHDGVGTMQPPSPGDVMVCVYCSGINVFTDESVSGGLDGQGVGIRSATDEERLRFMTNVDVRTGLAVAYQFQKQRRERN